MPCQVTTEADFDTLYVAWSCMILKEIRRWLHIRNF